VLVRQPGQEPAAHRRARAREARHERDRLHRPDAERLLPAEPPRDPCVRIALLGLGRAPPQPFRAVEHQPVQDQEDGRRLPRRERVPERVLEQEAEDSRRDRADDEEPRELRVGVVVGDLAVADAAAEAAEDPHPVVPEEAEEDERRRQVRRDEERQEERVVLVDVPAEELREDDAVPVARDREELGHPLQQSEGGRLAVRDHARRPRRAAGPLANQAKASAASPTTNAAIPCFTWWWLDPASWPGKNDGSDFAGSAQ